MFNIYEEILRLQQKHETFAVASILKAKGSTPRHIGKMIVRQDGSIIGTVGGGLAESYVIAEAKQAIRKKLSAVVEYRLDAAAPDGIQMLCGGTLTVFIEVVCASPTLLLLGAGHVGQALARLGDTLGYRVVVVDERPAFANRQLYPMASEIYCEPDILDAFRQAQVDADTYIVIATTDSDLRGLREALRHSPAYAGVIGSAKKAAKLLGQLAAEGVPGVERVFMPVGLDIGAETPEEIAVSVMAEIMCTRTQTSGRPLREVKRKQGNFSAKATQKGEHDT